MAAEAVFATIHRSHLCGTLRPRDAGTTVRLGGWVHRRRNLGGLVFIDLRDRSGVVQLSFDPSRSDPALVALAAEVGIESVIVAEGPVVERSAGQRNPDLDTGEVEVRPTSLRVVGAATTPAIPVARGKGEQLSAEEQRLRYRYLDLRRPELQQNLILRHRLMQAARHYLSAHGFLEIETPILTKPTPEGARDYLVPSRVHRGEFYALPQSPQLYKQLLMVAGYDRYFQIARCFRDEDLRADRQPEFTQIDIEASFIGQDDVFRYAEGLLTALWREGGREIVTPFPRMSHADALERYGTDRPDLRYALEISDVTDAFRGADYGVTRAALSNNGRVRGIRVPGGARLSRKQLDDIERVAKEAGSAGLIRLRRARGSVEGAAAKFLSDEGRQRLGLEEGDVSLLVAAEDRVANPALDRVRQELARVLDLVAREDDRFLWVTDFPLFGVDPDTQALVPEHHPFTAPRAEDLTALDSAPATVRAQAYDVVYNGLELASGSIRISDPLLQSKVFTLLGIDEASARRRFGFLLEGLQAGAPPHGGIAFGFDRIAMLLAGGTSLRDVIAFPKTTAARALFEGAPSPVPPEDLAALGIAPIRGGG